MPNASTTRDHLLASVNLATPSEAETAKVKLTFDTCIDYTPLHCGDNWAEVEMYAVYTVVKTKTCRGH